MKMKFGRAAGVAALFAACTVAGTAANAQSTPPPAPNSSSADVMYVRTGPGPMGPGDAMDFIGFEAGLGGKTVTGAPFMATMNVQRTQVLADGNQISRMTSGTIARDSEGRTRRDMTLSAIGEFATAKEGAPHVIFINDAVGGTQYILEPDRKIAHEVRLFRQSEVMGPKRRMAPRGGAQVGGDAAQVWAVSGQPVGDVTTTSLGTQTINGVVAQGTRYTRTIPQGAIGNEKPIVITTERWYSPDLQMYVLTKTTDPMRGNSIRQLTNIQMGEPDPTLFQVPPDYTLSKSGTVRIRRRTRIGAGADAPPPPLPDEGPDLEPLPPN